MKKIIFLCILSLLMPINVFANAVCEDVYDMSYRIMNMRQWGSPIVKQMRMVDEIAKKGSNGKEWSKLLRSIVVDAYDMPRFEVESNQIKASKDFANKHAALCYKQLRK